MTSYCLSDLGLRYHVAIFLDRTGILPFAFAFLATMCNKFPVFAGEILLERPFRELPSILIVATQICELSALSVIQCLRIGEPTFWKSCIARTCILEFDQQ